MAHDPMKHVLAIDLGGTQLRAALISNSGHVLAREATRTDVVGGPDAVISQIGRLASSLRERHSEVSITVAGVSCPGPLDQKNGYTYSIATLPGYDHYPFVAKASEQLGIPVVLEHDGHAAVVGEWRFGAGRGLDNFIYLTVSTGLGGGAIINGELLRGSRGMACHVGHMTVDPKGPICGCGNRGCWEMFASGTSFLSRARRTLARHKTWLERQPSSEIRAADIFAAAQRGDQLATDLVSEEAEWLGIGIVNLLHLYNPDRIVIGGGMSANFDLLLPGIMARIAQNAMPPFRNPSVVKAELDDNAGLIGVAMLAIQHESKLSAEMAGVP